jgi:hemoglobin-like flavoprotein
MGGGASTKYVEGTHEAIVSIMMPVYFINNAVVTPADITNATSSWDLIINDTSPQFRKNKEKDPGFTHLSCVSWFFSNFYARLFDVNPLCKPLFKTGLQSQGKFLIKMVSLTLSQLGDQTQFAKTMKELTIRHSEKGVKAIEYGVVGDVLFWCIKTCIGPEAFTAAVELSWVKIYSKMLQVIVPVAVRYEKEGIHQAREVRAMYATEETNTDTTTSGAATTFMHK